MADDRTRLAFDASRFLLHNMEHIQGYQDCSHQFHQESKVSATHAVVIHLQGPPSKSAFKFSFQNPNLPEIPLPFIDCWRKPTIVEIINSIMRG